MSSRKKSQSLINSVTSGKRPSTESISFSKRNNNNNNTNVSTYSNKFNGDNNGNDSDINSYGVDMIIDANNALGGSSADMNTSFGDDFVTSHLHKSDQGLGKEKEDNEGIIIAEDTGRRGITPDRSYDIDSRGVASPVPLAKRSRFSINTNSSSNSNNHNYLLSQASTLGGSSTVYPNDLLGHYDSTTYNDPIHHHIQLDRLSLKIIDTPQFQRLHGLKQLGVCDYVFRGATHTRFEHSIGVAHMAEKVVKTIQRVQPDLKVTQNDITCVKIAGLCHDLGHGPFSHVYDGTFITKYRNDWRHEDGSVMMLELLLEENDIDLEIDGNLKEEDVLFIKENIAGTPENKRKGRNAEKFWLYDIVNNVRSGLDVDKLDYFQRDMRYANVPMNNDFNRFIELGRVLPAEPILDTYNNKNKSKRSESQTLTREDYDADDVNKLPRMICYPSKMYEEAISLFQVRFKMHRTVYQHKTVKQIEFMLTDALCRANDYVTVPGKVTAKHPDGRYKMSDAVEDMEALSNLKDSIIDHIMISDDPRLEDSKNLINRIRRRDLYKCVGKVTFTRDNNRKFKGSMKEEEILKELIKIANEILRKRKGKETSSKHINGSNGINSNGELMDVYDISEVPDSSNNTNMQPLSPDRNSALSQCTIGTPHPHFELHPGTASKLDANDDEDLDELKESDIIVEKMHVHHGMKQHNPVSRLRFFKKHSQEGDYGFQIDEADHKTSLPSVFEELALRVFCRFREKEDIAKQAFVEFSRRYELIGRK